MLKGKDGCTCYDETTRSCPIHTAFIDGGQDCTCGKCRDCQITTLLNERNALISRLAEAGKNYEGWLPTADNINALPETLRRYIHDLATLCDHTGIVAENILVKDREAGLIALYEAKIAEAGKRAEDERDHLATELVATRDRLRLAASQLSWYGDKEERKSIKEFLYCPSPAVEKIENVLKAAESFVAYDEVCEKDDYIQWDEHWDSLSKAVRARRKSDELRT